MRRGVVVEDRETRAEQNPGSGKGEQRKNGTEQSGVGLAWQLATPAHPRRLPVTRIGRALEASGALPSYRPSDSETVSPHRKLELSSLLATIY